VAKQAVKWILSRSDEIQALKVSAYDFFVALIKRKRRSSNLLSKRSPGRVFAWHCTCISTKYFSLKSQIKK
jgi:hypothetical protein